MQNMCIKDIKKCNCLNINYLDKELYITYVSERFNITGDLLHTLYLSTREQLKSYISHYHKFNIDDLDTKKIFMTNLLHQQCINNEIDEMDDYEPHDF